jgi:hypothetical protein
LFDVLESFENYCRFTSISVNTLSVCNIFDLDLYVCRMLLLFKVMSVELLLETVVLLHGRLYRCFSISMLKLVISFVALFSFLIYSVIIQIEVPVGRGKSPVHVDKDESLGKVSFLPNLNLFA